MKKIVSFCLLLIPCIFLGQESEIVISEAKLQQLANKLYELKQKFQAENQSQLHDENFLEIQNIQRSIETHKRKEVVIEEKDFNSELIEEIRNELVEIRKRLDEQEATPINESIVEKTSRDTIFYSTLKKEEIINRLDSLTNYIVNRDLVTTSESTQIINETSEQRRNRRARNNTVITPIPIPVDRNDTVVSSLDSITTSKLDVIATKNYDDELARITNQIYLLHAKIDQLSTARDTVKVTSTEKIILEREIEKEDEEYQRLLEAYGDFSFQVFFANNSFVIEEKYSADLNRVFDILSKEDKLDLMIEGYASNRGDVLYNEELSMKRAIALKRKLMNKGIAPKRILTDYKGIDYEAKNDAEARRLDIRFVIRR